MRIRYALLCVSLGWPLIGRGQAGAPNSAGQRQVPDGMALKSAGDVTNITEFLEEKFRIPASPAPDAPPGANDVATADGRVYRNAQVWKVEPDGLTLRHAEGLAKVEFSLLPEAWRQQYGYDPEAAAAYQQAVAAAVAEAERSQRILREQLRTSPP